MNKKKIIGLLLSLALCLQLLLPISTVEAATTLYDNATGNQDGYDYELWKDYGTTSMTLNSGGTFSCQWSNIGNALFRKGIKFDSTKTYSQLGGITVDYGCNYQPSGNSYLCVYGWSKNPLVEFYIVESWGTWRPPGATSKGTVTIDGGTYEIYETTRVQQPSIEGTKTFQQYWSVRTSKRTSGTISVTEHFKAWEQMGMKLGVMYEVALTVEGYQSSGSANVYKNTITVGGSSSSGSTGGSTGSTGGSTGGSVSTDNSKECEAMSISGQYAGKISSPFSGVALYANNESCSYTQYFANGTHDFTLRGASNNSKMAKVDLVIGGSKVGTFYFGDQYPAEYTISNVSHGTGSQTIQLVVTSDDGSWDAYVDKLTISAAGSGTGSNSSSGNSGTSTGNSGTTTTPTKLIALTFDDGPSSTTSQVLDILAKYNVKATFFLIGNQIGSNQSIVQRTANAGHELANHSYTHSDMTGMSWSAIQNEINQTNNLIKSLTGQTPKFFRPPYISVNSTMYSAIDMAFVQGIMCNDWDNSTSVSQRVNTVLSSVSDGSIVLLHDFQGNYQTVQALPQIIEGLLAQGYTFVTMSELFAYKGVNPNVDYKIWSNANN